MNKLKYLDLFAGCGGLSLGLHMSQQWRGVFAVEKSPDAFMTLKHNLIDEISHFDWPKWLPQSNHNIDTLLKKYRSELEGLRGTIDLVVGGPPCQGFSFAGKRQKGDKRNTLVWSYLKLIELVKPRAILFENVKGFSLGFKQGVCSKTGKTKRSVPMSEIVLEKLHELGYGDASGKLINFSQFGVPQNRTRFIIAATLDGQASHFFDKLEADNRAFKKSKGLKAVTTLSDAVSDLRSIHGLVDSPDTKGFMAGKYGKRSSAFQRLMRKGVESKVVDSHRFVNHSKNIIERFQTVIDEKLTSSEIRERFNTKKCSTKLLEKDVPTPTVTTLPDDYVHYCEPRILTVREYARIQSFPDSYEFKGKYTTGGARRKLEVPRYSQIGNAIPPLFGEIAGKVLRELLDEI